MREERDRLQRLAETHFVGEDHRGAVAVHVNEPLEPFALVVSQRPAHHLAWRRHRRRSVRLVRTPHVAAPPTARRNGFARLGAEKRLDRVNVVRSVAQVAHRRIRNLAPPNRVACHAGEVRR